MVDHHRLLLLVHIARTGGTSIEIGLVGQDWFRIDPSSKHLSASQSRKLHGEGIWRDYIKFSVVRNPWDRLVSMWTSRYWFGAATNFKGISPASFAEFVHSLEPHPNERYGSLYYHEILDEPLDYILRFENLQDEFTSMLQARGLGNIELPFVEKKDREPYRAFYDDETASFVEERFARDIRDYGYSF